MKFIYHCNWFGCPAVRTGTTPSLDWVVDVEVPYDNVLGRCSGSFIIESASSLSIFAAL